MPWWLPYALVLAGWLGLLIVTLVALAHIFPEGGGHGPDQRT